MIRYFALLSVSLFTLLACHSTQSAQAPAAAPAFVRWENKLIDLGNVKKGEKRSMVFEFTNSSGKDIQIDIVDACDCTKVEFPRGVIGPGQKNKLDVTFDSTEKDASETIAINVIFKNTDANGNPRIETVEYKFELVR